MNSLELLTCAVLISISGFMSASEVALFSLSRFQLRSLKERFRTAHRRIKRLLGDPGGLLITILVVNEVVNISLSTIIADAVSRGEGTQSDLVRSLHAKLFPMTPEWLFQMLIGIAITTPVVLILCDLTPKVIAARANQMISTLSAGPLSLVYDGFKPVRMALKHFMSIVSRILGHEGRRAPKDGGTQPFLREEEFLFMIEEGHKEGAIQESEMELIRNVFDLDDTRVSEVYTPLSQVQSFAATLTVKGALAMMRSGCRYSRIPVTGANKREIVGILYSKDLLLARLDPQTLTDAISTLMHRPFTVPPQTKLNSLFRKLKENQVHMAVVEHSPGEALGIVTMSDVLDALFEDLLGEEEEPAAGSRGNQP